MFVQSRKIWVGLVISRGARQDRVYGADSDWPIRPVPATSRAPVQLPKVTGWHSAIIYCGANADIIALWVVGESYGSRLRAKLEAYERTVRRQCARKERLIVWQGRTGSPEARANTTRITCTCFLGSKQHTRHNKHDVDVLALSYQFRYPTFGTLNILG